MHLLKISVFIMITWATAYNQTNFDLFLPTDGEWTAVTRDYKISADSPPIQPASFLHGQVRQTKQQPRNAGPFRFQVDYPKTGEFIFYVETVSGGGPLIVRIDGEIVAQFALPAGVDVGVTSAFVAKHKLWRTIYNQTCRVPVPAGKHGIELENQGSDWISIAYFVFTNYATQPLSPEYDRWKIYAPTLKTLPQRLETYTQTINEWLKKSATDTVNSAFAPSVQLQLENLQQLTKKHRPVDFDLMRTESELWELLNYLDQQKDCLAEKRGRVKLGYFSEIDSTRQPYEVMVPENYDPEKKYSLLVNLHGFTPSIQKWSRFFEADADSTLDSLGLIKAAVYGRRNRYYLGAGEQDVLAAIAAITQNYSIDENRIYLTGESMGGYGAWAIGLHFPDMFAAISPVCAPTDFQNLAKINAPRSRNKQLLASASPVNFVQNARHVPARIYHGAADAVVPVSHSRQIVRHLRGMNFSHDYHELPGLGHDIRDSVVTDVERLPWLLNYFRHTFQRRLTHRTFYLKYGKNRYLEITGKKNWAEFAQIKTELFPPNVIQVQTQNVASFRLDVSFFRNFPEYSVDVDGHIFYLSGDNLAPEFYADAENGWKHGAADSDDLVKKAGLEGPWLDGETGPFALVFGNERNRMLGEEALAYYASFDVAPRLVSVDTAIQENLAKTHHLILLGWPEENEITRQLAHALPATFSDDDFDFNGVFLKETHGLRFIYPNPNAAGKYVLLEMMPEKMTHPEDVFNYFTPDYCVYSVAGSRMKIVADGFFDSHWQLVKQ